MDLFPVRRARRNRPASTVLPVLGTLALTAALLACGDADADDADTGARPGAADEGGAPVAGDWDDVVAAAEEEGAVTVYISDNFATSAEEIEDAFEEEYDIDLTLSPGHSRDHRERVLAESRSGNVSVDVAQFGVGTATDMVAEGVVEPLDVPSKADIPEEYIVFDEVVPFHVLPQGLLVNTEVIDELPTSFADLADERFADQLAMDDPRREGGGNTVFISLVEELGDDFVGDLAGDVEILTEAQEESIARGDYGVLIGGEPRFVDEFEGSPLTWIAPEEGAIVLPMSWALISGAPHPNAARVWAEFTLQPEIQALISTIAAPVIEGTEIANPFMEIEATLPVIGPDYDRASSFSLAEDMFGIR